jgi:ABC-type sugar transport system substrate-binding protein
MRFVTQLGIAIRMLVASFGAYSQRKCRILGLSLPTLQHPFCVTMKNEAEKAARSILCMLDIVDAFDEPANQARDLETFVAKS